MVLGLDFGTSRIGVAVGNTVTRTARELTTVAYRRRDAADSIAGIVAEWKPAALVVGHPLDRDGQAQRMSKKAEEFAGSLRERYGIETTLIDERYSSSSARAEKGPPAGVDSRAARIILEDWLARRS